MSCALWYERIMTPVWWARNFRREVRGSDQHASLIRYVGFDCFDLRSDVAEFARKCLVLFASIFLGRLLIFCGSNIWYWTQCWTADENKFTKGLFSHYSDSNSLQLEVSKESLIRYFLSSDVHWILIIYYGTTFSSTIASVFFGDISLGPRDISLNHWRISRYPPS